MKTITMDYERYIEETKAKEAELERASMKAELAYQPLMEYLREILRKKETLSLDELKEFMEDIGEI